MSWRAWSTACWAWSLPPHIPPTLQERSRFRRDVELRAALDTGLDLRPISPRWQLDLAQPPVLLGHVYNPPQRRAPGATGPLGVVMRIQSWRPPVVEIVVRPGAGAEIALGPIRIRRPPPRPRGHVLGPVDRLNGLHGGCPWWWLGGRGERPWPYYSAPISSPLGVRLGFAIDQ